MGRRTLAVFALAACCEAEVRFGTYWGGSGWEYARGVAMDSAGNSYVAGRTDSPDFPVVNATQRVSKAYSQGFVTKFDSAGKPVFSTYLGGSEGDGFSSVALGPDGDLWIGGHAFSTDFPVVNPVQARHGGGVDALVVRLAADGSTVRFATYLGGSLNDFVEAIAVAEDGVVIAGWTESERFPATGDPLLEVSPIRPSGFVAKLSFDGRLMWSRLIVGETRISGVAVDPRGNIIIAGTTHTFTGFVASVTPDGEKLRYYRPVAAGRQSYAFGVAVDREGNAYVTGQTSYGLLPASGGPFATLGGQVHLRSEDDGETWKASTGLAASAVLGLTVDPRRKGRVWAASPEGVFRSDDGGRTWNDTALQNVCVTRLVLDPSGPDAVYAIPDRDCLFMRNAGGFWRTADGGATWEQLADKFVDVGNPRRVPVDELAVPALASPVARPSTLFALPGWIGFSCCFDQRPMRSDDGGVSWRTPGPGSGPPLNIPSPVALTVDPANPDTVVMGAQTFFTRNGILSQGLILRSGDGGENWTTVHKGPSVHALASAAPPTMFAASDDGVLRSADSGATWAVATVGPADAIDLHPDNRDAFAWRSRGRLMRTVDGGRTSISITTPRTQPQSPPVTFAVDWSEPATWHIGMSAQPDAFVLKMSPDGEPLYATFFGGSGTERGDSIAVDAEGGVWVTGYSESADLVEVDPLWRGSARGAAFVARLAPGGELLSVSTRFGATRDIELVGGAWRAIAAHPNGTDAVLVGSTSSEDLPVRGAVRDTRTGDGDAYVFRLSAGP